MCKDGLVTERIEISIQKLMHSLCCRWNLLFQLKIWQSMPLLQARMYAKMLIKWCQLCKGFQILYCWVHQAGTASIFWPIDLWFTWNASSNTLWKCSSTLCKCSWLWNKSLWSSGEFMKRSLQLFQCLGWIVFCVGLNVFSEKPCWLFWSSRSLTEALTLQTCN